MNFYMEKNAEAVRHIFVSHEGKKELEVWAWTWAEVIESFREEIQKNIKTPWMSDWISPGFSTSTDVDEATATVLMMGLMKGYFDYAGGIICGIPSVTLLGTKDDWQRLLSKVDRLSDFGTHPATYASRLRPIVSRMVQTFDSPGDPAIKAFWNEMVQARVKHSIVCGYPPTEYIVSGWILGFIYWDATGEQNKRHSNGDSLYRHPGQVVYDGVRYGESPLQDLPIGYAKAKFKMLNCHLGPDPFEPWKGWVLAGSVGKRITKGVPEVYLSGPERHASGCRLLADPSPVVSDIARKADENNGDPSSNFLSRVLKRLNCFGQKEKPQQVRENPVQPAMVSEKEDSTLEDTKDVQEKPDFEAQKASPPKQEVLSTPLAPCGSLGSPSSEREGNSNFERLPPVAFPSIVPLDGHSTIQPLSGWFLFGPEEDPGPVHDGEEIHGPTVDAIESCNGTVHVDDDYYWKRV
jgi:hypothetical protein